jgi:hypothetical protein
MSRCLGLAKSRQLLISLVVSSSLFAEPADAVRPYSLTSDSDHLEQQGWTSGNWGNGINFEHIEVEGRGKVLKASCQHGGKPQAIAALRKRWSAALTCRRIADPSLVEPLSRLLDRFSKRGAEDGKD